MWSARTAAVTASDARSLLVHAFAADQSDREIRPAMITAGRDRPMTAPTATAMAKMNAARLATSPPRRPKPVNEFAMSSFGRGGREVPVDRRSRRGTRGSPPPRGSAGALARYHRQRDGPSDQARRAVPRSSSRATMGTPRKIADGERDEQQGGQDRSRHTPRTSVEVARARRSQPAVGVEPSKARHAGAGRSRAIYAATTRTAATVRPIMATPKANSSKRWSRMANRRRSRSCGGSLGRCRRADRRPRGGEVAEHDFLERRRTPDLARARTRLSRSSDGPGKAPTSVPPRMLAWVASSTSSTRCSAIASLIERSSSRPPAAQDEHWSQACSMSVMTCDERSGGRAIGPDRVDEHVEELAAGERIEARQRLVEEEHRRPRPERERQPDLRLLAPGQLVGAGCRAGCRGRRVAAGRSTGRSRAGGDRERDVVRHAELAVERRGLRHVADPEERRPAVPPRVDAVDRRPTLRRAFEADPRLEQRRLAGSVGPDQGGDAARRAPRGRCRERPGAAAVALARRHASRGSPRRSTVAVLRHAAHRRRPAPPGAARGIPGRVPGFRRIRRAALCYCPAHGRQIGGTGSPMAIAAVAVVLGVGTPRDRPVRLGHAPRDQAARTGRDLRARRRAARPGRTGCARDGRRRLTASTLINLPAVRLPDDRAEPGSRDRRDAGADADRRRAGHARPPCRSIRRTAPRCWPQPVDRPRCDPALGPRAAARPTASDRLVQRLRAERHARDDARGLLRDRPSCSSRLVAGQRTGRREPPTAGRPARRRDRRPVHRPAAAATCGRR